jgi:hypothetical protein
MFILSHGRPDRVFTVRTLERAGYTGDWYIVIDNEDKTADEYYRRFGEDRVIMFDKPAIAKTFDTADNFDDRKTIVFARNACFEIADRLGYTHFMELDDDYTSISFRFNRKGEFKNRPLRNLDYVMHRMIEFYEKSGATCLAFAQGGDFVGGKQSDMGREIRIKRKAMNTLLCSTRRPFRFLGRINEDVNTYVRLGAVGKLFMTVNCIAINQLQTQSNAGGMTDIYLENGTYIKSFYTVIFAPGAVKIARMGNKFKRIHHKILWRYAVPHIVDEEYRKPRGGAGGGQDWKTDENLEVAY